MFAYLGFDCFVFVCVFMICFSCFVVCLSFLWFGFLVAAGVLLFCRNSTSFPSIPTYHFWWTKKIRRLHLCRLDSKSTKPTIIQMQKIHCKQFVELARCEKVVATPGRVSFQLGLYFLCHAQILADLSNPSTERDRLRPSTPCATVLIIQQLLPIYMHHHELKLDINKANLTVEGHRLDNLPVPSMPWRPCTDLCFS